MALKVEQPEPFTKYEVESVTSKRYSIGEILATMRPVDDEMILDGPPVDFSFQEARKMTDFPKFTPRGGPHPYVTVEVRLPSATTAPSVTPTSEKTVAKVGEETPKRHLKYCSRAIRLSNNSIPSFDGFATALQAILQAPETLEWIDLSFNYLTDVGQALTEFENLKVLYLHANVIESIHQLDKLAALPQLKTLTMHGNLIDEAKGYRQYIVNVIPQLQYLDFSRITRADRDKAVTWKRLKIIGAQHRKKKKKVEN